MTGDQGFHIYNMNSRGYFSYFNWTISADGVSVTSNCGLTTLGYYYDTPVKGQAPVNWGCWMGMKVDSNIVINSHAKPVATLGGLSTRKYQNHIRSEIVKGPRTEEEYAKLNLPMNFSWQNVSGVDYVSPLRDQGNCGSCFAHASSEMMTARVRVALGKKGTPPPIDTGYIASPEDIVRCSVFTQGCKGGFNYLAALHMFAFGIVDERCFPYQSGYRNGETIDCSWKCQDESMASTMYAVDFGYVGGYYGAGNEVNMLLELYERGPIAVSLEVTDVFLKYKSGVLTGPSGHTGDDRNKNPVEISNHAVLLIGWGFDEQTSLPYWLIQNSWGRHWGDAGLIRVQRGTDTFAVESCPVYLIPNV